MNFGHEAALSGHLGRQKTLDRIATHFYWRGMGVEVGRWCQSCDLCQRTEPKGRTAKVPLGHMPVIDTPFKRVAVDMVGPIFPTTDRGHKYIIVMVDFATRYPEATALKNIEAEQLIQFHQCDGIGSHASLEKDRPRSHVSKWLLHLRY